METFQSALASVSRFTEKYTSFAPVYDQILRELPSNPVIVEIGIANGGSLEMWRGVFGEKARVIGVDLNPACKALEGDGYEVLIADMGSQAGFARLRQLVPDGIDLLVDDGGHTNEQQIAAIRFGFPLIRDGGFLVIEDIHSAFMKDFANPSRWSSWSYLSRLLADIHRLHPRSQAPADLPELSADIESVQMASGVVALRKRRDFAASIAPLSGGTDDSLMDYDHRWDSLATPGRTVDRILDSPRFSSSKIGRYTGQVVSELRIKRQSRIAIKKAAQRD